MTKKKTTVTETITTPEVFDREASEKALSNIYQNVTMSRYSVDTLLPYVENDNLKAALNKQVETYDDFCKTAESLADKYSFKIEDASNALTAMSKMGIKMKMLTDNSDTNVAKIMLSGTLNGVIEINTLLNHAENVSTDVTQLAKNVLDYQDLKMRNLYTVL
jgi:hypothetical protein